MEQGAKRGGWRGRLKNKRPVKHSDLDFSNGGPFFDGHESLKPVLMTS